MYSPEELEALLEHAQDEYMDALASGDDDRIRDAEGQLQELEYEAEEMFRE